MAQTHCPAIRGLFVVFANFPRPRYDDPMNANTVFPLNSPLGQRVRAGGYKLTPPRLAVLQVVEEDCDHLNTGEIFRRAQAIQPGVGLAGGRRMRIDSVEIVKLASGVDRRLALAIKRAMDVVLSPVALVVRSPLLLGGAFLLLWAQGRPVRCELIVPS